MNAPPLPYQVDNIAAIVRSLASGRSHIDSSDTGVGKTYMSLFAAKQVSQHIAVICPISVQRSWLEAAERVGASLWFVANIEALKPSRFLTRTTIVRGKKKTTRYHWDKVPPDAVLIVDEWHRASSAASEFQAIVCDWPNQVIGLSATPADSVLKTRALAHITGLCPSNQWWWWVQKKHGARKGFFGGLQVAKARDNEALTAINSVLTKSGQLTGLRKKDLGTMFPPCHIQTRVVPLDISETTLEKAYVEDLERLREETDIPAIEFLRSRQIAEASMIPVVQEMIDDLLAQGIRVAVFVNYKKTLELLKLDAIYHGEMRLEDRHAAVDAFQSNTERARSIGLTSSAGGESIDLDDKDGNFPRAAIILAGVIARELVQDVGRINRAKTKSSSEVFILFPDCPSGRRIRRIVEAKQDRLELLLDSELL